MNIIAGVFCSLISYLIYRWYLKWRSKKVEIYKSNKLNNSERIFMIYLWGGIIFSAIMSTLYIFNIVIWD